MIRFPLPRRTFLRGAGAAIGLPVLEAMLDDHGTALAACGGTLPRRFATWFFGNGVIPARWRPAVTGAGWQPSEALAPLASVKDYVNVVSGYDVKLPFLEFHGDGAAGMLSGYPRAPLGNTKGKFGGPSLNQVAAGIIGTTTTFPSLQMGVSKRAKTTEGPVVQYISHKGPDAPQPPELNPAALFDRLFSGFSDPGAPQDPRVKLRVSVLDVVRDQTRRLEARLGAADRARLDAHLTGISELQSQILAIPPSGTGVACTKPGRPTSTNADVGGKEPITEVSNAMSDLLVLAWACDLTRVASFQFFTPFGYTVLSELGHTRDQHALTHDSSAQNEVHDAVVFTMQRFAYLVRRLRATPEGTGNLLDNACVLCVTDCSLGATHSISDMPVVIAGRAGGNLKFPGVHTRGAGGNTSDVLLGVLQAACVTVTSVGSGPGESTTPATGFLT